MEDGHPLNCGQLWRRRPELVDAREWRPGRDVPGVDSRTTYSEVSTGKRGRKKRVYVTRPQVMTIIGWVVLTDGDWVVTYADGERSVYPPGLFHLAFEPA